MGVRRKVYKRWGQFFLGEFLQSPKGLEAVGWGKKPSPWIFSNFFNKNNAFLVIFRQFKFKATVWLLKNTLMWALTDQ